MDLIARLNRLGARIEEDYPLINCGGCCVFAAAVAARLEKHLPTRVRVGDTPWNFDTSKTIDAVRKVAANNTPREWNSHGLSFGHVIVEFEYDGKTYHYDTGGVKPEWLKTATLGYPIVKGHLTTKEALELASAAEGWNHMFDRADIPKIHRKIATWFNKIDNVWAAG